MKTISISTANDLLKQNGNNAIKKSPSMSFLHASISNNTVGGNSLFAFPAQSNFSGFRYSLEWIAKVHNGWLDNDKNQRWYVLLDAAAYVSTASLDLSAYSPDFVTLSFYKMFGFPTGLGKKDSAACKEQLLLCFRNVC